jgi:hypothetical protein
MSVNVCHLLTVLLLIIITDTHAQGTSYKRSFIHGFLLLILQSNIIMHVKLNIVELRVGLFKVAHFENGKAMGLYYGFREIVRLSGSLSFDGS